MNIRNKYSHINLVTIFADHKYPHLNALSQQVIAGSYNGVHDFEFGLNLILDGLEILQGKA